MKDVMIDLSTKEITAPQTSKIFTYPRRLTPQELNDSTVYIYMCKCLLTRIDLQTMATVWQAGEVGKSMGRLGRPRTLIRGSSPFWVTNSRQWSSVELLVRMASTNFIWNTRQKLHLGNKQKISFFSLQVISCYICFQKIYLYFTTLTPLSIFQLELTTFKT